MHRLWPIVLPTALGGHIPIGAFACDDIVHIAPQVLMESVNIGPPRIRPALGTLQTDCVRSVAIQVLGVGIVVRVTSQNLSLPIYKNMTGRRSEWDGVLHDPVSLAGPFGGKAPPAT